MTKAELKRIETARQYVGGAIKRQLAEYRDYTIWNNGEWAVKRLELKVEALNKSIETGNVKVLKYENERDALERAKHEVKMIENRLKLRNTIAFNAMKDAEKNYDGKVERMIEKVIDLGLRGHSVKIEAVSDYNREMEFLIHGKDGKGEALTCHARVIFVNGTIKAPHLRFITTRRAAK